MKNWIGTGRVYSSSADSWRSPLEAYECLRANSTSLRPLNSQGQRRALLREREREKSRDIHLLPRFLVSRSIFDRFIVPLLAHTFAGIDHFARLKLIQLFPDDNAQLFTFPLFA